MPGCVEFAWLGPAKARQVLKLNELELRPSLQTITEVCSLSMCSAKWNHAFAARLWTFHIVSMFPQDETELVNTEGQLDPLFRSSLLCVSWPLRTRLDSRVRRESPPSSGQGDPIAIDPRRRSHCVLD